MKRAVFAAAVSAGLAALLALVPAGCSPELILNNTAERTGNITLVFINDTPYRASFSFGTYDPLDRRAFLQAEPGAVSLNQLRLEANTTSSSRTAPCRRAAAIGTLDFVRRVLDTEADQTGTFDPDAFDTTVHFSSAPVDSANAAVALDGSAEGLERLLGVHFSCGDQLIITFKEDLDAPGGFRIDFAVLQDQPQR